MHGHNGRPDNALNVKAVYSSANEIIMEVSVLGLQSSQFAEMWESESEAVNEDG